MDDVPFCSGKDKEQKGVGLHYEHSLELWYYFVILDMSLQFASLNMFDRFRYSFPSVFLRPAYVFYTISHMTFVYITHSLVLFILVNFSTYIFADFDLAGAFVSRALLALCVDTVVWQGAGAADHIFFGLSHGQFAFAVTIAKSLNEFLHFIGILPIQK